MRSREAAYGFQRIPVVLSHQFSPTGTSQKAKEIVNDNIRIQLFLETIRNHGHVILTRRNAQRLIADIPGLSSNLFADPPTELVTVRPAPRQDFVRVAQARQ